MNRTSRLTVGLLAAGLAAGGIYVLRADREAPVQIAAVEPQASVGSDGARTDAGGSPGSASGLGDRSISISDGLLSLHLRNQLLGPVLAEIAGKGHVAIVSAPAVDARTVTMDLQAVPLEHGLRQLLRDWDVFYYDSAGMLRSAWVYERDAGAQIVPVPPENWASTADVMRRMSDGSPAERIGAVETLVARNGPDAGDIVSRALLDADAGVRERALDVGLSAGVNVSRETLTSLTYDSAAPVRKLALEALVAATPAGSPGEAEADELIRRMMLDADTEVRAKATELLESRREPP